ncbi:hypothetical protein RJT34_15368 [Clitoria ternatea]|uniref:Piwi domain-containing protein n=1 Tax=Clitoria ternatea TaxID=43366 RepID=A0AAN9PNQ7_CLITE
MPNLRHDKLEGKELELLIAILPDNNGSLYGDLKRICETDLGLISQCYLTKHVFKVNRQYLANVALKINVKMGGRNTVLLDALSWRILLVSDIPIIIIGDDVTHPESGEDSCPSIAVDQVLIVKNSFKICSDVGNPERGIVYGGRIRDGVIEGQFYQVLLYELDAIRKAYASLEPSYQPTVTFVVVQKGITLDYLQTIMMTETTLTRVRISYMVKAFTSASCWILCALKSVYFS